MDRIITYNNKTIRTKFHHSIDFKEFQELKTLWYSKPNIKEVQKEMMKFHKGGVKISLITDYFFKNLMSKVVLYHAKFSIEEVFECKELLEIFIGKVFSNENVFPTNQPLIKNIGTAFRLSGKGVASKPSNFPVKVAKFILEKYNINNNYYDFSCGWGVRMLSSLALGINYYGSDPNIELVEQLNLLHKEYKKINTLDSSVKIYPQGSEIFIPELENKIGISFSSPPYFNLEDYRIGNQSYKKGTTYKEWLNNFVDPMLNNLCKYAIDGGIIAINVKNFNGNNLYDDIFDMCTTVGLEFIEEVILDIIKRPNNNNVEKIMIFKKINKTLVSTNKTKPRNIVFSGCRNFNDYKFIKSTLDSIIKNKNFKILVGDATGVDSLIVRYAKENKIPYQIFKADWDLYGKSAGPIRNRQMIELANGLIAFWDGKSRGTKNAIDEANKKGIKLKIINII